MLSQNGWKPGFRNVLLFVGMICLLIPLPACAKGWGLIMIAPEKTNIRAERTIDSKLKGSLEAGQKIKADFPRDDWYAVFPLNQKVRRESKALGYVYAPRLQALNTGIDVPKKLNTQENGTIDSDKIRNVAADQKSVVKDIFVKMEPEEHERVFIVLNRFDIPRTSVIKGTKPRVVVDFKNVSSVREGLANLEVSCKYIRRIRSSLEPPKHTFRVVLDLAANKDYSVTQAFYKSDNTYVLDLSEDKNGALLHSK